MTVLVGEVWVALRPQLTSFGSDLKKELERVINPSGATGLSGLINKVGALSVAGFVTAAAVSAKFAIDQQKSQAQLQGTMDVTAQKAAAIGKGFLGTAGEATYSANEMMSAFAPLGGQLALINNGALTVSQSVKFMAAASELADATNQDLAGNTTSLAQILQGFSLRLKDAASAANTLYTTSSATAVSIPTLATTLAQLHMRLGDLAGSGVGSLTNVASLMVDLASHGTIGSRGIRAVASGLEHLIVTAAKSGPAIAAAVASAQTKATTAAEALQKAQERLAQKKAETYFSGGVTTPAQQFALVNAQQAVAAAQDKVALSQKNLISAQQGGTLIASSAAAEMHRLGLSLYDTSGKFIGFRALIAELVPAFKNLHGQTRELALSNLFGAGAAQQFNRIIEAGTGGYDKASKAVTRHNAVSDAAAAYQKTLAGQMKILRSTLSDLATDFGSLLLPALQDVAKAVAGITAFFLKNKVAAEILGGIIVTVLGGAMLKYVSSVSVKFAEALKGDLQGILKLTTGIGSGSGRVTLSSGVYKDALGRMHAANGQFVKSTPELKAAFAEQEAAAASAAGGEEKSAVSVVGSAAKQVAAWAKASIAAAVNAAKQVGAWAASAAETAAIWAIQAGEAVAAAARQTAAWAASAAETVALWGMMAAEAVTDAAIQVGAWATVVAAAVAAFVAENVATLGIAAAIVALVAVVVWLGLHWKTVWKDIKTVALDVWHFLDNDIIHPIEAGFHWLIGEIKAHWDLLLPIFLGPVGAVLLIWRHFHTQIVHGIEDIGRWFEQLPGKILKAVTGFASLLLHAGLDLIKGLLKGIENGFGLVRHTVAHLADNVVGWVESGFGIFSPSKKFADVGGHLMEGLAKGINDNAHRAREALDNLGLNVPDIKTGGSGGVPRSTPTSTTQYQLLLVMRQMVLASQTNTRAILALTNEEKKPVQATIRSSGGPASGGHGGGDGNRKLALVLAR